MKVSLAILNRNDLEGAKQVVPRIDRSLFDEIFVVDGMSTDRSVEFFREQGLEVIVQKRSGRGDAVRTSLERATGTHIVFLSTDGEEDPQDLGKFIERFKTGADLVIASRVAAGARHKAHERLIWIHRLWYLQFITFLINVMFGGRLTDCWNGYRGFSVEALRAIQTNAEGFLIEAQQTIRCLAAGREVVEFPTHEGTRVGGASMNPIFRSGYLHLVLLWDEWKRARALRRRGAA